MSQLKNGKIHEGIFNTLNIESGDLVIKWSRVIRDPSAGGEKTEMAEKPKANLIIKLDNLVQLVAKDVRFNAQVPCRAMQI